MEIVNMFETKVISEQSEFHQLKEEWNQLLNKSHTNTIFLTWEWLYSWWEVFGTGAELFIITVRNDQNELVGIAPLFIRKTRYYKFPVKEMTFIGAGHSDRQDFIILKNYAAVIKEIVSKIYEDKDKWDIVHLDQIPSASLLVSGCLPTSFKPEIEFSSLCPYLNIENNWENYFNSLDRRFRYDIRTKTKQLNNLGRYEFKIARSVNNIGELLTYIEDNEIKSNKNNTEKAIFSIEQNKYFLSKFLALSMKNNWLFFSTITVDNNLLAYSLGFIFSNRHYGYNTAYDINYHKYSPGKIVINETIKWFFENKNIIGVFDFSRGGSEIKSKWTTEIQKHVRAVFLNGSFYSHIIRYVVFRIRPFIKKLLKRENEVDQFRIN